MLSPSLTQGQTTTQAVDLVFTIPYTIRTINSDIGSIRGLCRATIRTGSMISTTLGTGRSAAIPLAQLTKGADGSYSGEIAVAFTVAAPSGFAGRPGDYSCGIEGCVLPTAPVLTGSSGSCGIFSAVSPSDPRLQVLAPEPWERKAFTW